MFTETESPIEDDLILTEDTQCAEVEEGSSAEENEVGISEHASETLEQVIDRMLKDIRSGHAPNIQEPATPADKALDLLADGAMLRSACQSLTVMGRDKSLGVVLNACILSMVGVLNLFLGQGHGYTWREASTIVAQIQRRGVSYARTLRKWTLQYLKDKSIPTHQYSKGRWSVIEDEDVANEVQMALTKKTKNGGYVAAADLVECYVTVGTSAQLEQNCH